MSKGRLGKPDRMGSTVIWVRRMVVYLVWTLALMPVQAIGLVLRCSWTARFPRFYHRQCCRILGFDVRRIGEPIQSDTKLLTRLRRAGFRPNTSVAVGRQNGRVLIGRGTRAVELEDSIAAHVFVTATA